MKYLLFLFLCIQAVALFLTGCSEEIQLESQCHVNDVTVNFEGLQWDDQLIYFVDIPIAKKNTQKTYLLLKTTNIPTNRMVMRPANKIWFNADGKKLKTIDIHNHTGLAEYQRMQPYQISAMPGYIFRVSLETGCMGGQIVRRSGGGIVNTQVDMMSGGSLQGEASCMGMRVPLEMWLRLHLATETDSLITI